MPLRDYIPLIRFIGSVGVPVLYIVSFANRDWVVVGDVDWGLWNWCYNNVTDEANVKDYVNDTTMCHSIAPGDSPGYYEGVRTVACFALVVFIMYFLTLDQNKDLGEAHKPIYIAATAAVLSGTTLGVLSAYYEEDNRWKDQKPQLGWCFWTTVAATILSVLMCLVFWWSLKLKRRAATRTPAAAATSSAQRPAARTAAAANPSSASSASTVGISVSGPPSNTVTPLAPPSYTEYPLLEMPPSQPLSPPPSYEDVMQEAGYPPAAPSAVAVRPSSISHDLTTGVKSS